MNTDRKPEIDPFKRATTEQQRAFALVRLTAKAMKDVAAKEGQAGDGEAASAIQVPAKALERALQRGGPQQRLVAVAEVMAHLEGRAQRETASGHKKLGGYLATFAMNLRANVAEPVKIMRETRRKRRQLPLPRVAKRRQKKEAQALARARA
jgi:hypothetical protein